MRHRSLCYGETRHDIITFIVHETHVGVCVMEKLDMILLHSWFMRHRSLCYGETRHNVITFIVHEI